MTEFEVGNIVVKTGGDYTFMGEIVSVFRKLNNGPVRYVVQNPQGILMIMNGKQITGYAGEQ